MKRLILISILIYLIVRYYPQITSFIDRWVPTQWLTENITYERIKDIYRPTTQDYQLIQKFLSKGKRPALHRLNDMKSRVRHLCIIGKKTEQMPQSGKIAVNCGEDEKENCLLIYASYNKAYPKGLKRLADVVAKSDFKGHILYRIGGWPNVEEGDLTLAHVPYGFKPAFFREAKRIGYKRVLWLDASILPLVSLNRIFDEIQVKGYFAMGNGHFVAPFMNEPAAASLGVTLEECAKIPSCAAGLFGVDFSNKKAAEAIQHWYLAARDTDAFFSPRSDQNALSIILYKLGMQQMAPSTALIEVAQQHHPDALFMIDRGFVQKW